MDSIDITDSGFSLAKPELKDVISSCDVLKDYNMFIYLGAFILVIFIIIFVYKFYVNKKTTENYQADCPGGFCTMNNPPSPTSDNSPSPTCHI